MTEPAAATQARLPAPAASPEVAPAASPEVPAEPAADPADAPRRLPRLLWPVVAVALVGALAVAGVGFGLSYRTLVQAAESWSFGHLGSRLFPLGIDGAILAFYAFDLILVYRRMPKPLLRWSAHGMTLVTVLLNIDAAAGSLPGRPSAWQALADQPGRLISHAAMPIVFVIVVEGARHAITRTAQLERGTAPLGAAAWLLAFPETWRVFRTAKIHDISYKVVREQRRTLAIHRVWVEHRDAIEAGEVSAAVLAELLAPHGVSVDEAMALPDKMRSEEQDRAQAAEAARRERDHAARLAELAAEAEELRTAGEVDVLRAQVEGEREAAQHRARGAASTAAVQADAATRDAERAATVAERRAADEQEALETERAAAARRKAAEDKRQALKAEAEIRERRQVAADQMARVERTEAETQRLAREKEEDAQAAAAAHRKAAEDRDIAARVELAAVAAEDAARLPERERAVRRVARLIRAEAGGEALRLPLARIEDALGVANGTASAYRSDAERLLAAGYDPAADPLHSV